jgi:hypothetical protein
MNPIVISFYTLTAPNDVEVKKLIHSCVELEIESDIVGLGSEGSWEKHCALKPFFILQKLKQWDRPILWVDAHAIFKRRPDFSEFATCDVSVRMNEFLPKAHESRIVSNTVFIRNNSAGVALLEEWCRETDKGPNDKDRAMEFWDQTALRDALHRQAEARFLPMPLKYAKIFDFDNLFISEQEIVIEHHHLHQASRRFKNKVNESKQNHCCH